MVDFADKQWLCDKVKNGTCFFKISYSQKNFYSRKIKVNESRLRVFLSLKIILGTLKINGTDFKCENKEQILGDFAWSTRI